MKKSKRINNPNISEIESVEIDLTEYDLVIQFDSAKEYTAEKLAWVNKLAGKNDNIQIRFYGHYGSSFDCTNLQHLPAVENLAVDCLHEADNVQCISDLKHLKKLAIGIYNLKETEILSSPNFRNIRKLALDETKTKALNLSYLKDFNALTDLYIKGHNKGIDAIKYLDKLQSLSLSSTKNVPLEFINELKQLRELRLLLGGRNDITDIRDNSIERLEIRGVRGFNNLSNICNFKKLRELHIEDSIQLKELHFDNMMSELEKLHITTCKSLSSLTGLEKLPNLKSLNIYHTDLQFDRILEQTPYSKLQHFGFYTSKESANKSIREKIIAAGYKTHNHV